MQVRLRGAGYQEQGQSRRASRRWEHFMESWRSSAGRRGGNAISQRMRERKSQTTCWPNGKKFHVVVESLGKTGDTGLAGQAQIGALCPFWNVLPPGLVPCSNPLPCFLLFPLFFFLFSLQHPPVTILADMLRGTCGKLLLSPAPVKEQYVV